MTHNQNVLEVRYIFLSLHWTLICRIIYCSEDEAGGATEGQKKYTEKALDLLRSHPNVEWIQAEACAALASMTSGLCVRRELEREHTDWLEDVVTAIMGVKSITQVVKETDSSGKESR